MADVALAQTFGPYRILGLLGRGGMGSVYLAEQTGPGGFRREVVLKLIRVQEGLGEEFRRLLLDEAQLTALINHPNVVTVYDFGEHQGNLYITLGRIYGVNLLTIVQRLRPRRLPIGLAAVLIAQACDGLHAAHELVHKGVPLKIIHRDVSPSNIMVDIKGWVRVIDFGIARPDARHARHAMTSPEMVRGNPAYMAPEQIVAAELDRTVDVYAAALIFYELCTGSHPFDRSLRRSALAPLRGVCEEISSTLNEVVNASLSLDPGARPAQISTLGAVLWDFARRHGYGDPAHGMDFFRQASVSLEPDAPRASPIHAELVQANGPTSGDEQALHRRRPATAPAPRAQPRRQPPPPPPDRQRPVPKVPRIALGAPPESVLLASGEQVRVYTTQIRVGERGPHSLALSRVPALAPLPLSLSHLGDTLCIHCAPSSGASERIALYVDAQQPDTRLERLLIGPGSPAQSFEVGHRRHVVRRLACTVGRLEGERWVVRLTQPAIEIEAPPHCTLLAALVTREDNLSQYHIEGICIHINGR